MQRPPLHRLIRRSARAVAAATATASALALVTLLPAAVAAGPVTASGDTICAWGDMPIPGNTLTLLSATAPPHIDPTGPCACCVSGAKYGLGVFGTDPGAGAFVFYSLGVVDLPLFGEKWVLDPTQLVGSVFLTPDPSNSTFANACWVEDDCLTIPENPALIGLVVYLQAASPSTPDWVLSNRADLLIGTQF